MKEQLGRLSASLRFRVGLASGIVVAVALVITGLVLAQATVSDGRKDLDLRLERQAGVLSLALPLQVVSLEDGSADLRLIRGAGLLRSPDAAMRFFTGNRMVFQAGSPQARDVERSTSPGLATLESPSGEQWRTYTRRIPGSEASVQAMASLEVEERRADQIRRNMALLAVFAVPIAAFLAAVAAGFALRPLRRLRDTADEVARTGELAHRVPSEGATEIRSVATALNIMLDRLEGASQERERALVATRRFIADAGHEFRTPLATLGATLELLVHHPELEPQVRESALTDALAEERRLAYLTDALLVLARDDIDASGDEREVDLIEMVNSAVVAAYRRHPEADFSQSVDPGIAAVTGSPSGLRTLVDNLLENAAIHGSADGPPAIAVTLRNEGDLIRLIVEDSGPGIPEAERESVFDRFHRVPGSAEGGSGLGLALVAQQARRHGGRARATATEGGGARLEVTIRKDGGS